MWDGQLQEVHYIDSLSNLSSNKYVSTRQIQLFFITYPCHLGNTEMNEQSIEKLKSQVIPLLVDSWARKQESKKIFEATVAASGELSGLTLDQCPLKHSPSHFMFDF